MTSIRTVNQDVAVQEHRSITTGQFAFLALLLLPGHGVGNCMTESP
jgi:hypothetical protein